MQDTANPEIQPVSTGIVGLDDILNPRGAASVACTSRFPHPPESARLCEIVLNLVDHLRRDGGVLGYRYAFANNEEA